MRLFSIESRGIEVDDDVGENFRLIYPLKVVLIGHEYKLSLLFATQTFFCLFSDTNFSIIYTIIKETAKKSEQTTKKLNSRRKTESLTKNIYENFRWKFSLFLPNRKNSAILKRFLKHLKMVKKVLEKVSRHNIGAVWWLMRRLKLFLKAFEERKMMLN